MTTDRRHYPLGDDQQVRHLKYVGRIARLSVTALSLTKKNVKVKTYQSCDGNQDIGDGPLAVRMME